VQKHVDVRFAHQVVTVCVGLSAVLNNTLLVGSQGGTGNLGQEKHKEKLTQEQIVKVEYINDDDD
jgi:hypothetical protein